MKDTVSTRGVVYQWNPNNPVNGSLFYAYEYAIHLGTVLYIIGALSESQLQRVRILFNEKYILSTTIIVLRRSIDLYTLSISKLLFIDIRSFYNLKELVPQGVECHVFSNTIHPMWRYSSKSNRNVIYYGSYPEYQRYDVECILKLYFGAMRCTTPTPQKVNPLINPGTPKKIIRPPLRPPLKYSAFVSYLPQHIPRRYEDIMGLLPPVPDPQKPYLLKSPHKAIGNILELTETLYYIHNGYIDTNNRVIPEFRWFHGDNSVNILYTNNITNTTKDSVYYRSTTDIHRYNLDDTCEMICQMQMQ